MDLGKVALSLPVAPNVPACFGVPPPAAVPIYVGALRPAMLELAGEVGDGVAVNLFPAEALPKMLEHVALGARRAGKDPRQLEVVCRHQVLVTDDKSGARELFRA